MNEKTLKSKIYKLLLGPTYIIDGIILTMTFGYYLPKLSLKCATNLARSRAK